MYTFEETLYCNTAICKDQPSPESFCCKYITLRRRLNYFEVLPHLHFKKCKITLHQFCFSSLRVKYRDAFHTSYTVKLLPYFGRNPKGNS